MRVDTATFATHNVAKSKEPRYVVALSFDSGNTILWYFTSHADAALPGGGSVTASVIEALSGTSQTLNPDQANATIGNISFDVVDKASAITNALGSELALGRSTRQQRVQVYMGYKGDAWADYTLIQTQFVTDIGYTAGKYTFRCQDVQRVMRADIFTQAATQLAANVAASALTVTCLAGAASLSVADLANFPASGSGTIRDSAANDNDAFAWTGKSAATGAGSLTGCTGVLAHNVGATICDATINVVDTSKFTLVAHGTSYSDAPSATVGYLKINNEVVRYSGKTATTFTGCARGALNTIAAAQSVDLTQVIDQRTPALEYVYLELPAVDLMYRLLTGLDRLGNPVLPTNWNLGISPAYVRLSDFTGIGADLWNLADDQQGFVVRFEDLSKTDGKKFIETELALLLGVFMPIYANGSVGCRRMANILSGAAYTELLTEATVVSCGELTHDFNSLHNVIQVSWNWEPSQKEFTRINIFLDQPSITIHKQAPTLKLAFRGLHGSRHSAAMLASRFDMLRDRYTGPPLRLTSQVLHRFNSIEVGDVLRNKMATVRDFVANGPLDRSFEVQGIAIDWVTGALSLTQFASSRAPSPLPATGDAVVISNAWYSSQGTLLASGVGGITITGANPGHITVGGTLAGNADLTNAAAIYYYPGDLQLDAGVNLNITQNVQLRVMGNFTNNGTINGVGAGLVGAAAQTSPGVLTNFGILTNTQNLPSAVGFLGMTEAGGGINGNTAPSQGDHSSRVDSFRSASIMGVNAVVPSFNVTWNGTLLTGLPTDLRGTPGPSGVSSAFGSVGMIGGAGGNGGAGLLIVCRGYATGAAGKINLSGSDGLKGQNFRSFIPSFDNDTWAGSGAGGAPGGLAVFLDGSGVTVTGLTDAGFVALYGNTPVEPFPMNASSILAVLAPNSVLSQSFSSFYVGTGDGTTFPLPNLSGARGGSRVQYVLNASAGASPDPVVSSLLPPTSMGLVSTAAELLLPGFGVALSRIRVTWSPSTDARVVGYDLQYKLSTDSVWSSAPPVLGQGSNVALIMGVVAGQLYDVQLRAAGATREVSAWVTITGFPVFNQLAAVPANVTGFSAQQQGVVVSFNWDQVVDYALKGYDIGFAPMGTTNWDLFEPLTEVAKGTEMTNASVPPGTWVFGIRARNIADQLSPAITTFNLTVTNANPVIAQVPQEPNWLGAVVNLVLHWTGVLVPLSTKKPSDYPVIAPPAAPMLGTTPGGTISLTTYFVKVTYVSPAGVVSPPAGETLASAEASQLVLLNNLLTVASPGAATGASAYNVYVSTAIGTETLQNVAPIPLGTSWTEPTSGLVTGRALPVRNGTGFEPFDIFVPDPVASASYTALVIDTGLDDTVRVFATTAAPLGPGQSGVPSLQFAIDTWLTAGSDTSVFVNWVLGFLLMRFLVARLTLTITPGAVPYLTDFTPTVDKAPVIEHVDSVVVAAGGTAITFPTPFHVVPNVQVTPISAGATSASATSLTTTGFTAHVWTGASDTGGTANWVATGE